MPRNNCRKQVDESPTYQERERQSQIHARRISWIIGEKSVIYNLGISSPCLDNGRPVLTGPHQIFCSEMTEAKCRFAILFLEFNFCDF